MDYVQQMNGGMQPKEMKRVFARIGLATGLFIFIQQLLVIALTAVVSVVAPQLMNNGWFTWVMNYGALYLVSFPIFLLVIKPLHNYTGGPEQLKKPGVGGMVLLLCACIGIVLGFNMLSMLVSQLFVVIRGTGINNPLAEITQNSNPWVNYLFVGVIAPVMEEIIFRGLLYKKLIVFGGKAYIIFSALMFGMMHPNIYQFIYATILGVIFATVRYFTGKLHYTIILHLVINGLFGGGTPLMIQYLGQTFVAIYSVVAMVVGFVGLVLGIVWFAKKRHTLVFAPPQVQLPSKSLMFLNPGFLFYAIFTAALVVLGLVL